MNTKPSLGTGLAGVFAHAVAAGIIASSSGNASAACAPLRNVRLGIAFLVMNIVLSLTCARGFADWGRCPPHLKRNAPHNPEDNRREAIAVFLRVAHDPANGRRIVVLDAASERERQKVLRQTPNKQFGPAQQRIFQSRNTPELRGTG